MDVFLKKDHDLNLEATELRLGLPGTSDESEKQSSSFVRNNHKRPSSEMESSSLNGESQQDVTSHGAPVQKAQVVGWPPVQSHRKNVLKRRDPDGGILVKVSMDGAPYLRKIDVKCYKNYQDLFKALESMFKCSIGLREGCKYVNESELVPTYEDKDGDWMLVGDVPWDMFSSSCKRMRIMRGFDVKGGRLGLGSII